MRATKTRTLRVLSSSFRHRLGQPIFFGAICSLRQEESLVVFRPFRAGARRLKQWLMKAGVALRHKVFEEYPPRADSGNRLVAKRVNLFL